MAGLTIAPFVAIKRGEENCLQHELVHIEQQRRDGLLRFGWRYLTRPEWLIRYEAAAYAVDVRNGRLSLPQAAALLSGSLYRHPCSYDAARAAIQMADP
jgi:hypothetical protein